MRPILNLKALRRKDLIGRSGLDLITFIKWLKLQGLFSELRQ